MMRLGRHPVIANMAIVVPWRTNRADPNGYYAALGLAGQAMVMMEDIRKAYRRRVREVHPDAGGDIDVFRRVQLAYETLSDPVRRAVYDSLGSGYVVLDGRVGIANGTLVKRRVLGFDRRIDDWEPVVYLLDGVSSVEPSWRKGWCEAVIDAVWHSPYRGEVVAVCIVPFGSVRLGRMPWGALAVNVPVDAEPSRAAVWWAMRKSDEIPVGNLQAGPRYGRVPAFV
jgi:hypothetical protein